jgi:uncharacterized membrane protein YhaH (DUF805 family)
MYFIESVWISYTKAFRLYFDFKTRTSRGDFWRFTLCNFLIALVVCAMPFWIAFLLIIIYGFLTFIPNLAITTRRLHDTGASGVAYFIFLVIIPLIVYCIGWIYISSDMEWTALFFLTTSDMASLKLYSLIFWLVLCILPMFGISLIISLCLKGDPGPNCYGGPDTAKKLIENPKENETTADITRFTGFFHDGDLISIENLEDSMILTMRSSEVDSPIFELFDDFAFPDDLVSADKRIKGKLHITGLKSTTINDEKFSGVLSVNHGLVEIAGLDIKNHSKVLLNIFWEHQADRADRSYFSSICIEAEKVRWENLPNLESVDEYAKDCYLDKNGNPVARGSSASCLLPE